MIKIQTHINIYCAVFSHTYLAKMLIDDNYAIDAFLQEIWSYEDRGRFLSELPHFRYQMTLISFTFVLLLTYDLLMQLILLR